MAVNEIINEAVTQDMQLYAANTKRFVFRNFCDLVIRDLRTIDDGDRAGSKYFHYAIVVEYDRRVFIYADTQIVWIVRDRSDQAADTLAR